MFIACCIKSIYISIISTYLIMHFFKALLFLCAGIMYTMARMMNKYIRKFVIFSETFPITYKGFLISVAVINGFLLTVIIQKIQFLKHCFYQLMHIHLRALWLTYIRYIFYSRIIVFVY